MLAELHPPLSAFPFALTTAVVIGELCAVVTKNPFYSRGAHYLLLLTALLACGTYYSGYFAAESASNNNFTVPQGVITAHQAFAKAALILLLVSLLLSQLRLVAKHGRFGFILAYWVSLCSAFCLVVYTGWLGGQLVFRHGAGVIIDSTTP